MRALPLLLTGLVLAGAFAVAGAGAQAEEITRLKEDEVVQRGLAKGRFGGYELRGAVAYLEPTGEQYAGLVYGGSDGGRAFSLEVRWLEPARAGAEPARDWSVGPFGSDPDRYWHPLKQVRVRFRDSNPSDGLDLDAIRGFVPAAADQVAGRARPWPEPLASLALEPELHGYRLVGTAAYARPDGTQRGEFRYRKVSWRSVEEGMKQRLDRQMKVSLEWYVPGKRPGAEDETYWRYRPLSGEDELERRPVFAVRSRTHYVRGELRGEHRGDSSHFADREQLDAGIAIAQTLLQRIEARLAEPRDPGATGADAPRVSERPAAQAQTQDASGTITSVGGALLVFRGGGRVNLRQGGRVQRGDTLVTGSGPVVIRFDDPEAGPASNGTLTIGPRSKVTIDVGPYRREERRAPTRIRVEEGGVRFERPHHHTNLRVELGTAGDVAIFGLTGTDAVFGRDGDAYLLVLRDGMGDLALGGKHAKVLVPISAHAVAADGRYLWGRAATEAEFRGVRDRIMGAP